MEGDKPFKLGSKFLGNTGTLVSDLCLGTMTFSLDGLLVPAYFILFPHFIFLPSPRELPSLLLSNVSTLHRKGTMGVACNRSRTKLPAVESIQGCWRELFGHR